MISLHEIAKSINEDPRDVDNIDRSKGAEKKDQDADRVGRDDGDTWMAPSGDYGGKHNGEIQYFDDEDSAKVYAKSGSKDGKGGEEKPDDSSGKLGGSDFDRDGGDSEKDDEKLVTGPGSDDDEDDDFNQDIIDPQGVDAIEAGEARDYIESNDLDADGIQNMWDSLQAKGYKYYDNYYRDVGKDIQRRIDYLKDGKGHDGFPMTSDVAEMKDKAKIGKLMQVFTKQHPLKKSDKKSESIKVIDGKKYKAIKESKEPTKPNIHPFKETYKKIGGK
jgi:hypothetical protein